MSGLPEDAGRVHRPFKVALFALLVGALVCGFAASTSGAGNADAAKAGKHRVGGKVKKAWPRHGNPPKRTMARWLARQVGPVRNCGRIRKAGPPAARRRANERRRRCLAWHRRIGVKPASARVTASADPGAPVTSLRSRPVASVSASAADPILLTRSYQIPKDDPDYERLLNWSWTYDSAVTAAAFVSLEEKEQATQILDQLAALQFNTGAIDIAFNVITGEGAGLYRSGNVAWLGLAAATYNLRFDSDRYLDTARRSANFLIELQGDDGLIKGGPGIEWKSTLHNLVAYSFLMRLAKADSRDSDRYLNTAGKIADGIDGKLIVDDKTGLHFLQGVNDTVEPLDAQAIGAIYLEGQGRESSAKEVTDRIFDKFEVSNRKIQLSSNPLKYNMTWSSKRSFTGFKPYNSSKVPSVIWFEGTAQVRAAAAVTGGSVSDIDDESKKWREVTASGASGVPLQANETISETKKDFDVEYHVWPAASAAAWWLLASNEPGFLIP